MGKDFIAKNNMDLKVHFLQPVWSSWSSGWWTLELYLIRLNEVHIYIVQNKARI